MNIIRYDKGTQQHEAPENLADAVRELIRFTCLFGFATLDIDGKEIANGHICGNKAVINWRD